MATRPSLIREFYALLRENRKWWLIPILLVIALFAILVLFTGTPAAPFIYTLF